MEEYTWLLVLANVGALALIIGVLVNLYVLFVDRSLTSDPAKNFRHLLMCLRFLAVYVLWVMYWNFK